MVACLFRNFRASFTFPIKRLKLSKIAAPCLFDVGMERHSARFAEEPASGK